MFSFDLDLHAIVGPAGSLPVPLDDEITLKLAMLIEGQCGHSSPALAAEKFGFSRARYYQVLKDYRERGAIALLSQKPGPKAPSKLTDQVVRQVIRHRFLDPDASSEVVAQKIRQNNGEISARSVERVIEDYGLQKKTLPLPAKS